MSNLNVFNNRYRHIKICCYTYVLSIQQLVVLYWWVRHDIQSKMLATQWTKYAYCKYAQNNIQTIRNRCIIFEYNEVNLRYLNLLHFDSTSSVFSKNKQFAPATKLYHPQGGNTDYNTYSQSRELQHFCDSHPGPSRGQSVKLQHFIKLKS